MNHPVSDGGDLHRRYALAEQSLAAAAARRVRRTPAVVIALLALLVLGVGLVSSTDLRRLQTPRGTALAWAEAALFGDCRGYDRLSIRPPGGTAAPDPRSDDQRCTALRGRSQDARLHSAAIRLEAGAGRRVGPAATVELRLIRAGRTQIATLALVRRGHGWVVLRDSVACGQIGCA